MEICGFLLPRISLRKVAFVLFLMWLITMVYLWLPNSKKDDSNSGTLADGLTRWTTTKNVSVVHVVLATDEITLGGMIATINSIVQNTKHHIQFHLVTVADCAEHLRTWLQSCHLRKINYEIKVFDESWVKNKIKLRGGRKDLGKPIVYARFYVPRLFPEIKGRLIYLDVDTIVQGDIADLNKTRIRRGHIAAVSEDCNSVSKRFSHFKNTYANFINFQNPSIKRMHLNPLSCSFNTGVYVADMKVWNQRNITLKLEHWIKLNTRQDVYGSEIGGGGAQPPMMIAMYKKYSLLNPMWNVRHLGTTLGKLYSKQFLSRAKLLHWDGRFKPWGRSQFTEIWDKYYIPDPLKKFQVLRKKKS